MVSVWPLSKPKAKSELSSLKGEAQDNLTARHVWPAHSCEGGHSKFCEPPDPSWDVRVCIIMRTRCLGGARAGGAPAPPADRPASTYAALTQAQ